MNDFQRVRAKRLLEFLHIGQHARLQPIEVVFLSLRRDAAFLRIAEHAETASCIQILQVDAEQGDVPFNDELMLGRVLDKRLVVGVFQRIDMRCSAIFHVVESVAWGKKVEVHSVAAWCKSGQAGCELVRIAGWGGY